MPPVFTLLLYDVSTVFVFQLCEQRMSNGCWGVVHAREVCGVVMEWCFVELRRTSQLVKL